MAHAINAMDEFPELMQFHIKQARHTSQPDTHGNDCMYDTADVTAAPLWSWSCEEAVDADTAWQ